ncbi:GNAT family N-acetyltransferase [Zhihengliuella halotolerans]|uniref:GNAT family N-acetyltransferase n=1 Tax=Zhihengliuella halotolerans TaxID=370736 RepID=UPI000C7F93E6
MSSSSVACRRTDMPTDDDIDAMARVWSAASARRDGLERPIAWQAKRAGVLRRLKLPSPTALLLERAGSLDAFALAAEGDSGPELFYLAVDPNAWGSGLAGHLLAEVESWATENGCTSLRLWVIDSNDRAQYVYRRAGWKRTEQVQTEGEGAKPERLYIRVLE